MKAFAALLAATATTVFTAACASSDSEREPSLPQASSIRSAYSGIERFGVSLGDPEAPVVIDEFIDPRCKFCARYQADEQPAIIEQFVRTGQVRINLRVVPFVASDSERASRYVLAAAEQGKAWEVAGLILSNRQDEDVAIANDSFLKIVAKEVGISHQAADELASGDVLDAALAEDAALADKHNLRGTPAFLISTSSGKKLGAKVGALHADEIKAFVVKAARR